VRGPYAAGVDAADGEVGAGNRGRGEADLGGGAGGKGERRKKGALQWERGNVFVRESTHPPHPYRFLLEKRGERRRHRDGTVGIGRPNKKSTVPA